MSPDWLALKFRVEQQVPLEPSKIELAGHLLQWYRVGDGEGLLNQAVDGSKPSEEIDPFWAATWRAARGLDRFLANFDLRQTRILELGCGSGQAGIGAALRGAHVTMTDAVGIAMLVARLNATCHPISVQIRRLKWDGTILPLPKFPLIIGSDLVYDPNLFERLELCARSHLTADGRSLLSEPHRHTGDRFAKWIVEAGWKTEQHDVDLGDGRIPIRVFECWWRND